MHFIKAIVWGISLAAVNAAALPADGSGVTTCEFSGGDRACEAHCIEKGKTFVSCAPECTCSGRLGNPLRRLVKRKTTSSAKPTTVKVQATTSKKPTTTS
ncbi:Myosin light chain kinase, smooth muscle, partial [Fusarium agapanthi]